MTISRSLAGVIGPSLLALGVTEALNIGIFESQTAPVVYLNGTLLFVAGVAIVRAHNLWTRNWRILVTLSGWAALLLGLYRMIAPGAPQASAGAATYATLALLAAVGAVLTVMSFAPRDAGRPESQP